MSFIPEKKDHYTCADYGVWDEGFRAELIDGRLYIAPPTLMVHQEVFMNLMCQFYDFVHGSPARMIQRPFCLRLFPQPDESDDTVLEPDFIVMLDRSNLHQQYYGGAPDLVIEIVSPDTAFMDCVLKQRQYLKAGVREYWLVDQLTRSIEVKLLKQQLPSEKRLQAPFEYTGAIYDERTTKVPVSVLPGCEISLPDVFADLGE
jgi:Uma2 family endonuclease